MQDNLNVEIELRTNVGSHKLSKGFEQRSIGDKTIELVETQRTQLEPEAMFDRPCSLARDRLYTQRIIFGFAKSYRSKPRLFFDWNSQPFSLKRLDYRVYLEMMRDHSLEGIGTWSREGFESGIVKPSFVGNLQTVSYASVAEAN